MGFPQSKSHQKRKLTQSDLFSQVSTPPLVSSSFWLFSSAFKWLFLYFDRNFIALICRRIGPNKLFHHYCKTLILCYPGFGFVLFCFWGGGIEFLNLQLGVFRIRKCLTMLNSVWLLCMFPSASFLGGIFYWLKCYDFYSMLPLYVGFVSMLSSICHSFGNVLFFLGLAITGKDKDLTAYCISQFTCALFCLFSKLQFL